MHLDGTHLLGDILARALYQTLAQVGGELCPCVGGYIDAAAQRAAHVGGDLSDCVHFHRVRNEDTGLPVRVIHQEFHRNDSAVIFQRRDSDVEPFAHNREDNRIIVIEINPRTSRSSALASKATGFPIASVSTKLASGVTMDELPYWRKGSLEKYEPYGDYVVVKFARWAFEKFPKAADKLGTQMKAVGEVMSIGQNFKEAFQKAVRSLEIGRAGLGRVKKLEALSTPELREKITYGNSERFFQIYELLRRGAAVEEIVKLTRITPYFIEQMKELADFDFSLDGQDRDSLSAETLRQAKEMGFSDKYLAQIFGVPEKAVRARRQQDGITATFRIVPVSGVEHAEYYYSTYSGAADEVPVNDKKKIMILGGGPNRIGQGIEFDYTCVHAAFTLRDHGYESIMVNCNPETVSTDFDTANKLYFEPVTVEDVLAIYEKEKPEGVIVQFGGQTPLPTFLFHQMSCQ